MSKNLPKKKSMKGGELQLNEELLFNMALQILECTTNYALTHGKVLQYVRVSGNNITPEMVSMLRKKRARIFQEIIFDDNQMGLREHIIYPLDDCTLTFNDLKNLGISFQIFFPQINIIHIYNQSFTRIIIEKDFYMTHHRQSGKYEFDANLENMFGILTDLDKRVVFGLLSSKKLEVEPLESQSRWWDMYEKYSKYMGNPEMKELMLKVLYDNDPSKMAGGKIKRVRQTPQSKAKRIR